MPEDDDNEGGTGPITRTDVHLILSIFLGSIIAVQAWDIRNAIPFKDTWGSAPTGNESTAEIASILFTDWAFPFEVLSILLLVALVGALAVAMRDAAQGGDR